MNNNDSDIEEIPMQDTNRTVKDRPHYTTLNWLQIRRELTSVEKKRVEKLTELSAWKRFARSPIFTGKLAIDFREPRWGITGRLPTDKLYKRFERIPDVITFFSDNNKADQYLRSGMSSLDVFIIYNSKFIGLQGGRMGGRDSTGRDFFMEEHTSRKDLEIISNEYAKHGSIIKVSVPLDVKVEFNKNIAMSCDQIRHTINGYNCKETDRYPCYDNQPLVCKIDKCPHNLLGLAVKCCNKPVCFTCMVKIAERQLEKWLFEPTLVKCDQNKCRKGLKFPVIESEQVIDSMTYSYAFFRSKICSECQRGYQNKAEHVCDPDDKRIIAIAINPEDSKLYKKQQTMKTLSPYFQKRICPKPTASATVTNQSQSKASVQKSHASTTDDFVVVSSQSSDNLKKKSSTDGTYGKRKSDAVMAYQCLVKNKPIKCLTDWTLAEIESVALKSGGVFKELWTRFEVQQKSVLELNEKMKQQTETIKRQKTKQQTETIKQQMETIERLQKELSEEKRRSETSVTEQTDLLKNKELFERFAAHLLDKQRKKTDKNFNKFFDSFSLKESVLKRQNLNEDDGNEDSKKT